jgi:ribosomal protein RSM22 (predicted rRNA methylase)
VRLVDASRSVLERASCLFTAAGLDTPSTEVENFARFEATHAGAIAVPFALNELPGRDDPRVLRRHVERWVSMLSDTGRLYLLEPGTPRASRRLQLLRDQLPNGIHIHAPCTGARTCPLLSRPNDWCHFTWSVEPGPLARAVADRAQRRWQEQHLSFLILGRTQRETRGLRVLDVRPHGRSKVVARTCGPDGLSALTALRRDPAYSAVSDLGPGSVVRVRAGGAKGDGLRVVGPEDVEQLASL